MTYGIIVLPDSIISLHTTGLNAFPIFFLPAQALSRPTGNLSTVLFLLQLYLKTRRKFSKETNLTGEGLLNSHTLLRRLW